MKIRKNDYQEILKCLTQKRWEGEAFVAFPYNDSIASKEELFTFSSKYEAREFCFEMSTDIDYYNYLSIRSAYRAMAEALNDNTLLMEKDGIVDVQLMVSEWYQRLEAAQFNNNQNIKIMNQKNFEYLKDQVKYTGFGEGLENDLKQKMEEGKTEFKLQHQAKYGNDSVTAELNFGQSKKSDMYFFNSYRVAVQKGNSAEVMEQTFYISKSNNITLKEAYNLMEGRAVNKELTNKEGGAYNAWIQMDFKQSNDDGNYKLKHYHEKYGYDLEAVLSKHPIRELTHPEFKESLLESLKKGNLQSVTFQVNGAEQKQYIEANPQFKTINIYDSAMQKLDNRRSKREQQSEGESQSTRQESNRADRQAGKEKQAATEDDGPDIPKKASKKRKTQSQSM